MTRSVLIYERPRTVTKASHAGWGVKERADFDFARGINAVPLTTAEFAVAAREFPIVFTEGEGTYTPTALLGLRDEENLFVGDDGQWRAQYVPAFLRRYPFVFAHDEAAQTYTLCIDEGSDRVSRDRLGQPLFEASGEASSFLKRMGDFARDWQRAFQTSQAFCARLKDLDLLDSREISFTLADRQTAVTRGFSTVDRDRLHALDAEQAAELLQSGDLELVHAHLLSLGCVDALAERLPPAERMVI